MEEDKKILYIAAIIVVIIFIAVTIGVGVFFYFKYFQNDQLIAPPPPPSQNTNIGYLPSSPVTSSSDQLTEDDKLKIAKEKQFISSFWQDYQLSYQAQSPNYKLPLAKIKEQVANYRDFSRKINLDKALDKLSKNGFIFINNPFDPKITDWQTNYKTIKDNKLPIFVTTDSAIGIYQDTLNIVYKEIEQDTFYSSLWYLLKDLANSARQRYETRHVQYGIKNDIITEANRLELAYVMVGLKLLQPESGQIKDTLAGDKKYFSSEEAGLYTIATPPYLAQEIDQEIKLIKTKTATAKSPIFLYQKNYQIYSTPPQYNTSEKLKNYYFAITWLRDGLFPLWNKDNGCDNCLLDPQDHTINFIASLYLSNDLAAKQNLKNRWANIYKSIAFFKGLELNLTYLDYDQAMMEIFGKSYDLNNIFSQDNESIQKSINELQGKIQSYSFPKLLAGAQDIKEKMGLRLLRDYYLPESRIFINLTRPNVGNYTGKTGKGEIIPFTACRQDKNYQRCLPLALDIFNFLSNHPAKTILQNKGDSAFEKYNDNLNRLSSQLQEFDKHTWHDNAYLSLLSSLKQLKDKPDGFPIFMQSDLWSNRNLSTSLGAWVNFHKEINFEKSPSIEEDMGISNYFPYGYVEPYPELYAELAANVDMVIKGFTSLEIISTQSKSFERLQNLKNILTRLTDIAKKELTKEEVTTEDFDFINNFGKQIKAVSGDVKKENLQTKANFNWQINDKTSLNEYLDGLNFLIAIYPDKEGKLFFAIGPVYNYLEGKNKEKPSASWQAELKP